MHTEPKPVEPIKRPPLTENSELPPTAEELENVTIRVVRLDQLAGAAPAERAAQPAGFRPAGLGCACALRPTGVGGMRRV